MPRGAVNYLDLDQPIAMKDQQQYHTFRVWVSIVSQIGSWKGALDVVVCGGFVVVVLLWVKGRR